MSQREPAISERGFSRATVARRSTATLRASWSAVLFLGFAATSHAAPPTTITLDGSLGAPGTVTGTNHLFTITPAMGKSVGANLFHRFGTFNLGTGDTASFGVELGGTANVIARVTGGTASTIDGTMACPCTSSPPTPPA